MSTIVIYDSGVGGLSIFQQVVRQCVGFDYVFVSDNAAFPYGTKLASELRKRAIEVVDRIDQHYAPDLLIVACNTASTIALDSLREKFDFPIVGVVPAIKPASALSCSKVIGLLATPGTIARDYTENLIQEHAADCEVHKLGSSRLVEMAEAKLRGGSVDHDELAAILQPLLKVKDLDVLVLACTHFPLLRGEIESHFADTVEIIDSGAAIASRVKDLSKDFDRRSASVVASFTENSVNRNLAASLEEFGFNEIEILSI